MKKQQNCLPLFTNKKCDQIKPEQLYKMHMVMNRTIHFSNLCE